MLLLGSLFSSSLLEADDVLQVSISADGVAASSTLGTNTGRRLSADGRFVVLESTEGGWVPGIKDLNTQRDIFLFDRQTQGISLVSHTVTSAITAANGASRQPVISADGLWVAFLSSATDLIPSMIEANTPTQDDVFLFHRATGALQLVSHSLGLPSQTGDGGSFNPKISDDGRFVVFESQSQDLVTQPDSNGSALDIFLFDRLAPAGSNLLLVSGASQTGNGSSSQPALSGDGNWVAFTTRATNLVSATDGNGTDDVFLWQRSAAGAPTSLTLLSHRAGDPTTTGNDRSRSPTISRDGNAVAFSSESDDLVTAVDTNGTDDLFLWQQSSGLLTLASHLIGDPNTAGSDSSGPGMISADGSQLVFLTDADDLVGASGIDSNGSEDVFVYSVAAGTVSLVSHAAGLPLETSNRGSQRPKIEDDGSSIVFGSFSTDLTANSDTNGTSDIFRWHQMTGTVELLSHAMGQPTLVGNGPSSKPEISGDGSLTVLESLSTDLVAGAHGGLFAAEGSSNLSLIARRAPLRNGGAHHLAFDSTVDRGRRQISEDGRFVVFTSEAVQIVPGQQDINFGAADVFLLDIQTGIPRLVSHIPGQPLTTANSTSELPEISSDGAWILFRSRAIDLVSPSLPNLFRNHIYLYEVATGNIRLVTHAAGLSALPGNRTSDEARLSADGTRIAIASEASNLTTGTDLNLFLNDIFLYDIATDTMTRVSNSATGASTAPVLDDMGDFVAFQSTASDLVTATDTNGASDIFLFDRITGTTALVSQTVAGTTGNSAASQASISGDGERVAFRSFASDMLAGVDANGNQADVFYYQRSTGNVRLVSHLPGDPTTTADRASNNPVISRDGQFIALDSTATNLSLPVHGNLFADIFLFDVATDTLLRVSQTPTGDTPNGHSTLPSLSGSGDAIAYSSTAQDITTLNDGNGALPDLFFFDAFTSITSLISRRFDDTASANASSERAIVSGNGNAVLFRSVGGDLMAMVDNASGPGDVYLFAPDPTAVDLSLTLMALPSQGLPGSPVRFELNATNASALPAPRTVAVLDLPLGSIFQGSAGASWNCAAFGSTVICDHDAPLNGVASTLEIDALMPLASGPWTARGSIKSLQQEEDPADNFDQVTVTQTTIDLGDAPSPGFPTRLAESGAFHGLGSGLHLGSLVDGDGDGQPTPAADGDDSDGTDDEDGVLFTAPIQPGLASSVDVEVSADGHLDAWVDWNGDGDWNDADEKILHGVGVTAGTTGHPFAVPASASLGDTFARFRLSSAGTPLSTGPAADGEVEDHLLTVVATPTLAIDDVSLAEGDAGLTAFQFTVSLTPTSANTVSVDFTTIDGTATTTDGDYQAASGTLTFAPGAMQQTLVVNVVGDLIEEENEAFTVQLSNPSSAVVGQSAGLGTITDDDDQGPPQVTLVQALGDGSAVPSCSTVRQTFESLRLTFDQEMRDPPGNGSTEDVTNPANYLLLSAGPDADFRSASCAGPLGDDIEVPITSVLWNAVTSTADLLLSGDQVDGLYRLFGCPDLQDLAGNRLDGDGDGVGGEAFVLGFRRSAENLFVNGHFDDCQPILVAPWESAVTGSNQISTTNDDEDMSPLSGSAVFQVFETSASALRQCVEANAGARYRWAASLRFQPASAATGNALLACEYFDAGSCTGGNMGELSTSFSLTPANQDWQSFEATFAAPPTAASARCRVEVSATLPSDPVFDLKVDGLTLVDVSIFADGFESSDTSAWSLTFP